MALLWKPFHIFPHTTLTVFLTSPWFFYDDLAVFGDGSAWGIYQVMYTCSHVFTANWRITDSSLLFAPKFKYTWNVEKSKTFIIYRELVIDLNEQIINNNLKTINNVIYFWRYSNNNGEQDRMFPSHPLIPTKKERNRVSQFYSSKPLKEVSLFICQYLSVIANLLILGEAIVTAPTAAPV